MPPDSTAGTGSPSAWAAIHFALSSELLASSSSAFVFSTTDGIPPGREPARGEILRGIDRGQVGQGFGERAPPVELARATVDRDVLQVAIGYELAGAPAVAGDDPARPWLPVHVDFAVGQHARELGPVVGVVVAQQPEALAQVDQRIDRLAHELAARLVGGGPAHDARLLGRRRPVAVERRGQLRGHRAQQRLGADHGRHPERVRERKARLARADRGPDHVLDGERSAQRFGSQPGPRGQELSPGLFR